MEKSTDADLVALARRGDKNAFGLLVERHMPMARRVATGVVGAEDIGRELAQEAMLQAYLSLERLRDADRFQSWLYGIVLNVCRSYIRDQRGAPLSLEAMMGGLRFETVPFGGFEPDAQEVLEAQELHGTVLRAVKALSPKNRAATLLFYYQQLDVREIAATLGVSVSAVKGRLHKARGQLRERLLRADPELSRAAPKLQGRIKMVKVVIADMRRSERKNESTGESNALSVVLLYDAAGRRVLPIWMGVQEGTAIVMGLREYEMPRPLTHTFAARLLEAAGAKLEEVRIEALKDDTYYAVAKIRIGDAVREVDARPSDALALAVLTGSPIYAAEEVMMRAGHEIAEELGAAQPQPRGIDRLIDELREYVAHERTRTEESKREKTPEELEKARQSVREMVADWLTDGEPEEADEPEE